MSRLEPMFSVGKEKAGLDRIIVTQSDGQRIIVVGVGDEINAYDSGTCGKAAHTPRIIPKES